MKRPACFQRQTGACRRCGLAVSQPCRRHEEPVGAQDLSATDRRTPTDWWRTRRRRRSVPGVQRKERSTPTARRASSGRSDQLQLAGRVSSGRRTNVKLQPQDWTEDEGSGSAPSFRPALPAKDQRQLRIGSNSLVGDHSGERIILRSYPCNRDHAPRFLWSETLGKA